MPESKPQSASQQPVPEGKAPSGVLNADRSATWDGRRRVKIASDKAMTGVTLDWVISLPAHLRPKQLTDRIPRIANSLAAVWKDRAACLAMLTDLLTDQRQRRRGFSVVLRQEIERLLEYRQKQDP